MKKEPLFIGFVFITLTVMLLYLLLPVSGFSERENRRLSTHLQSVMSIDKELHHVMTDRFPLRSAAIALSATLESALFGESGGVLRAHGRLYQRHDSFDSAALHKNTASLDSLASKAGLPLTKVIVPRPCDIITEAPLIYRSPVKEEAIRAVQEEESIPFTQSLTSDCYYKTDHHLNEIGTKKLLLLLEQQLGITLPIPEDETQISGFRGSAYRQSGLWFFPEETLCLPRFSYEGELSVRAANGAPLPLYDSTYFSFGDRYSSYFGGNHPLMILQREPASPSVRESTAEPRKTLLVVKDSYANAVLPYLSGVYDIVAVDPRYFRGDLSAVIRDYGIDAILLLMGAELLSSERECVLYWE